MGIEVLGISCVTNLAAGLNTKPLSHEEVSETGRWVESRLAGLLKRLTPRSSKESKRNREPRCPLQGCRRGWKVERVMTEIRKRGLLAGAA